MHKNFNEWYIDVAIDPKDGQLEKRSKCIEEYTKKLTADPVIELVKMYFGIPVSNDFMMSFADKFIKEDPTFSVRFIEELSLLAGATLVKISETRRHINSFVELLSIASYNFRQPRSAKGILDAIKEQFTKDCIKLREFSTNGEISIYIPTIKVLKEKIENDDWDINSSKELLEFMQDILKSLRDLKSGLSSVKDSQNVYIEDSQILWWLTSGWSNDLNCPFKNLDKVESCLIIGKEAADLVTNFPGPYAIIGVLNRMIDGCNGSDTKIKITELMGKIDSNWKTRQSALLSNTPLLELLPISAAIVRSENTENAEEWFPKYMREMHFSTEEIKLSPLEYAIQMYFESMTHKCYNSLTNK